MRDAKQHAAEIVRTLRGRGQQAYLAGGCVRDLLLSREPADYDVATDATPQQVMQIFPETYAVGEQFGVVLVPGTSGATGALARQGERGKGAVEVATFRSDVGYSDGRHPDEVRFTKDPREDVQRRDFTINGMMLDPGTNEILDFVGGRDDLKAGIVRAIGDPERRFAEDKLRMLRAVRFAARFDYQIDPATMAAIQKLAPKIRQVSSERVREELTKMLTEGQARRAFELLDTSGLLPEVLPEIAAMKGVEQPPEYHPEGDVFVHALLLLEKLQVGGSKTLAWGALLHDVGKPPTFRAAPDRIRFDGHVEVGVKMAAEICRRLRFSNDETDQILALVDNHMRFGQVQRMNQSTLKKFLRLPAFDEHLELHRIDCLSSHGQLDAYDYAREQLRSLPPEAIRPTPLITGQDLIEAGYEPGPRFKEVLAAVEDAQLEGRLTSREAAMEYVRREFPV
ncbi:MAG TPA: CCA tRNA nucleotidyltransferase [Terriglobales bacterium]|jgi:poly(A) polymerase|nr:CCA tRNA nucleotidyltransferase [Terriglobales bacterium]